MTDKEPIPMERRLNRANGLEFALRLFEHNRQNGAKTDPMKFRDHLSHDAFAIIAFMEIDMDTTERTRAVDIALQIAETQSRNNPENRQILSPDSLFELADNVRNFIRHEAQIIC